MHTVPSGCPILNRSFSVIFRTAVLVRRLRWVLSGGGRYVFHTDNRRRRGGDVSGGRASAGRFAAWPFRYAADARDGTQIDHAADYVQHHDQDQNHDDDIGRD
jgi:hypothetical protein